MTCDWLHLNVDPFFTFAHTCASFFVIQKGKPRPMSLLTSPAAGMKTVDPLPLREDCEANVLRFAEGTLPVSKILDRQPSTPGQLPPCAPPYCHPSSRIQGRLRDPEFQHNSKY